MSDDDTQRGLVIISALLNFVDWLESESMLTATETERGKLVLAFLNAHSDGETYFMQAEQIAARLSTPFKTE